MDHDLARDVHLPSAGAPVAAAVVLHPHPAMGGDRRHPLMVSLADALAEEGVAAARLDLPDPALDVAVPRLERAATAFAEEMAAGRLVLLGYSWGALVTALAEPAGVLGRVLVAPPVTMTDLAAAGASAPALALVPEHDQYGPRDAVTATFADRPDVLVETVAGTDHFLAGAIARITDRSVTWVTKLLGR